MKKKPKKAGRKAILTEAILMDTIAELDAAEMSEAGAIYQRLANKYGVKKQSLIVRVCGMRKKLAAAAPPVETSALQAQIDALTARLAALENRPAGVKVVPMAGVVLPKEKVLEHLDTQEWKDYRTLSQEIFGGYGEENRIRGVVFEDKGRLIESRKEIQFRSGRNVPVTVLRLKDAIRI